MPRLSIPPRYKNGLLKINSINDSAFNELASVLKEFKTINIDLPAISRISSATPNIAPDDLDLFLETLLALHAVRTGNEKSSEQFSDDVIKELEASGTNQLRFAETEAAQRQKFVNRLNTLFALESLAIVAKARDLQVEHEHVFLNGRIMTDLRPVFRGTPEEAPLGMLLSHVLKLSYIDRERDGERSTFYLALDEGDVVALKRLLERAESKARTLRSKLESVGINCLGEARSS